MWLLKNGYDEIWLKSHTRRTDLVYTVGEWYRALDLWNLFDGICFDHDNNIVMLQIKTNAWAKEKPLKQFAKDHKNIKVSVNECKGRERQVECLHKRILRLILYGINYNYGNRQTG